MQYEGSYPSSFDKTYPFNLQAYISKEDFTKALTAMNEIIKSIVWPSKILYFSPILVMFIAFPITGFVCFQFRLPFFIILVPFIGFILSGIIGSYTYRSSVNKQFSRMENELRQVVEHMDQVTGPQGLHWTLETETTVTGATVHTRTGHVTLHHRKELILVISDLVGQEMVFVPIPLVQPGQMMQVQQAPQVGLPAYAK